MERVNVETFLVIFIFVILFAIIAIVSYSYISGTGFAIYDDSNDVGPNESVANETDDENREGLNDSQGDDIGIVGNIIKGGGVSGSGGSGGNGGGNQDNGLVWPPEEFNGKETKTYAYEWKYNCNTTSCLENGAGEIRYPNESVDNLVSYYWLTNSLPINQINDAVMFLNSSLDGHRVLFSWSPHNAIHMNESDFCSGFNPITNLTESFPCLWWGNGTNVVYERFDEFFHVLNDSGVDFDVFVLDYEAGMSNWQGGGSANWSIMGNLWHDAQWVALENDSRFIEDNIMGGLISEGFYYDGNGTLNRTVHHFGQHAKYANGTTLEEAFDNYHIWNSFAYERVADYMNQALYDSFKTYYPNAKMSNYQHRYWNISFLVPDANGHEDQKYGNGVIIGTHQSRALYGNLGWISNGNNGPGGINYESTAFNSFRYTVNIMRAMYLSRPDVPISPWMAGRNYIGDSNSIARAKLGKTDYYQEDVMHAGLVGVDYFIYWNPFFPFSNDIVLSDTLHELDFMTGYNVSKQNLIVDLTNWTNDYIYSGIEIGDYKVWRFSFNNDSSFSFEETDDEVIFYAGNDTIVFSQGEIYEPEGKVSNYGYWVVQPRSAGPVIPLTGSVIGEKEFVYYPRIIMLLILVLAILMVIVLVRKNNSLKRLYYLIKLREFRKER